jgi:hypothetical protein
MLMRYLLLTIAVFTTSCASHTKVFTSPTGNLSLTYDPGGKDRRPAYQIRTSDGSELGEVNSIVDAETLKNVPNLNADQEVIWSPSGRTALIYENTSDASPCYQHVLIRFNPESRSFNGYKIDLGTRHSSPEDIYGHWPSVRQISDSTVDLEWHSEPTHESVEMTKLISDSKSTSEQDEPSNDE